eukprot:c10196_g1_i1.p1 GENE.c10196_g1_i1~~c10196_g1_i1.p1  ORF type:complete len:558 (-),score=275.16 c10196_g1_i1:7-1680(-)
MQGFRMLVPGQKVEFTVIEHPDGRPAASDVCVVSSPDGHYDRGNNGGRGRGMSPNGGLPVAGGVGGGVVYRGGGRGGGGNVGGVVVGAGGGGDFGYQGRPDYGYQPRGSYGGYRGGRGDYYGYPSRGGYGGGGYRGGNGGGRGNFSNRGGRGGNLGGGFGFHMPEVEVNQNEFIDSYGGGGGRHRGGYGGQSFRGYDQDIQENFGDAYGDRGFFRSPRGFRPRGGYRGGRGGNGNGGGFRQVGQEKVVRNSAFLFIKPHANTEAVRNYVERRIHEAGLSIVHQGLLTAEQIESKKIIDQHYYSIASKATLLKPNELSIPEQEFKKFFNVEWKDVLQQGQAYNAIDACTALGITGDKLDELWAQCKSSKKLVKFGGGFYCGLIHPKGKSPMYVFNGFFMSMREKYTHPDASVTFYIVEWNPKTMSWTQFRSEFLGCTDPSEAVQNSLRSYIKQNWEELGLKQEPNTGDNGVHASASPFEALAEKMNWLRFKPENDYFGRRLLYTRIPIETIQLWTCDPQVSYNGSMKSLFDSLEDTDAVECLHRCESIYGENSNVSGV